MKKKIARRLAALATLLVLGAPVLVLAQALSPVAGPGDENWDDRFRVPGLGLSDGVENLALTPTGDVIAVGSFLAAGGKPNATYIARWDGTDWQALGSIALDPGVFSVAAPPNGDVIVGGTFSDLGGNPNADGIARGDGTAWRALGTGINGDHSGCYGGPKR